MGHSPTQRSGRHASWQGDVSAAAAAMVRKFDADGLDAGDLRSGVRYRDLWYAMVHEMAPQLSIGQVLPLVATARDGYPDEWTPVVYVAEVADEMVGFSRGFSMGPLPHTRFDTQPGVGYADELYVRPAYRGSGLGVQLSEAVMAALWAAGVGRVWGHPRTPRLEQLWASHGAAPVNVWEVTRSRYQTHP